MTPRGNSYRERTALQRFVNTDIKYSVMDSVCEMTSTPVTSRHRKGLPARGQRAHTNAKRQRSDSCYG